MCPAVCHTHPEAVLLECGSPGCPCLQSSILSCRFQEPVASSSTLNFRRSVSQMPQPWPHPPGSLGYPSSHNPPSLLRHCGLQPTPSLPVSSSYSGPGPAPAPFQAWHLLSGLPHLHLAPCQPVSHQANHLSGA